MNAASLVRIEFRRSVALLCFPLLVGVAWFIGRDSLTMGFLVWQDTSSAIRASVLFVGPLIGGLSAWTATRNKRRGIEDMLSTAPRPAAVRELATWAGTALWGVAVYALYAAVLLALTFPNATWGAPLPGYLLAGLFTVIAASALGYAAGYYLPSRFVPPLAAVLLFGPQIYPLDLTRFELFSPAPNGLLYVDVFQKVPQVALPQSSFFLGLAGVALAAVTLKTSARRPLPWAFLLGSVAAVVAGASTLVGPAPPAGAAPDYPQGFNYEPPIPEPFDPVCEDGGITVCVHPAYESLLPEIAATVNEVAKPLAGLPGAPTRAVQIERMGGTFDAPDAGNIVTFQSWSLDGDGTSLLASEVAWGMAHDEAATYEIQASAEPPPPEETPPGEQYEGEEAIEPGLPPGMETCEVAYDGSEKVPYHPAWDAQGIVSGWLMARAGYAGEEFSSLQCTSSEKYAERFAALDPAEREAWLRKNLADLRAGKLTPQDLP